MPTNVSVLFNSKFAVNTETAQYTSATGVETIIDKFTATNTSAANATITVKIIPSGGSAATSNIIVASRILVPGETYGFPELVGCILDPGDTVSTLATITNVLVIRASGRKVT